MLKALAISSILISSFFLYSNKSQALNPGFDLITNKLRPGIHIMCLVLFELQFNSG